MNEDIIIPIAGMLTALALVLGIPLVIVHARKLWMRDSASAREPSGETNLRLERIENAVDAIAVEVERIAESQRFLGKLMADRAQEKAAIPASRHQEG